MDRRYPKFAAQYLCNNWRNTGAIRDLHSSTSVHEEASAGCGRADARGGLCEKLMPTSKSSAGDVESEPR